MFGVKIKGLHNAKSIAGELVAQFNQNIGEHGEPIIVLIREARGNDRYEVTAYYASGQDILPEELANAYDMAADFGK